MQITHYIKLEERQRWNQALEDYQFSYFDKLKDLIFSKT